MLGRFNLLFVRVWFLFIFWEQILETFENINHYKQTIHVNYS